MPKKVKDYVENVKRKRWDLSEFERKAKEKREKEEQEEKDARKRGLGVVVKREPLKQRGFQLDLFGKVGKYTVITNNTPLSGRGGFYCEVCDCLLKDSSTYLDHINGKKHQRRLGMNMRPERSSLQQVKKRFALHKRKKEEVASGLGVEERLRRYEEELRAKKRAKKLKRKGLTDEEIKKLEKEEKEKAEKEKATAPSVLHIGEQKSDILSSNDSNKKRRSKSPSRSSSPNPSSSSKKKIMKRNSRSQSPSPRRNKRSPSRSVSPIKEGSEKEKTGDDPDAAMKNLLGFVSFGGSKKQA